MTRVEKVTYYVNEINNSCVVPLLSLGPESQNVVFLRVSERDFLIQGIKKLIMEDLNLNLKEIELKINEKHIIEKFGKESLEMLKNRKKFLEETN